MKWADYITAYKSLPAAHRANASWVVHPDALSNLGSLVDTAGGRVWSGGDSAEPRLLGLPIVVNEYLAAPAASAKSVVLGDFSVGYTVRRVAGLSVLRLEERYSDNGQLGYRLIVRVDGRPVLTDAIRILAHSAT